MAFLDWLLGAPTMDKVARDITRRLQALDAQDLRTDLALGEMRFKLHGGEMHLFLANLVHDLQQSRRAERPALLRRFLDGMLSPEDAIPASYADARPRLLPVVRHRGDIGIVALTTLAASAEPAMHFVPATKPLTNDLVIALVCDRPTSMAYVNAHDLSKWVVSFDQALADALDNLRALPEHGGWQPLRQGVWSGEWGDAYASSRILLPDLIQRVGVRDPIVAVPFRNALMLTGADNDAGLALMAKVIEDHAGENQRWLSFRPLRLHGTEWRPCRPEAADATWDLLHLHGEAQIHQAQKQLLDAWHARTDVDLFVASYGLLKRPDGAAASYCVWSENADSLLPRTDLIAFAQEVDGATKSFFVPWADACAVVGSLMEATTQQPDRLRVRSWPDAAQLQALADRSVEAAKS